MKPAFTWSEPSHVRLLQLAPADKSAGDSIPAAHTSEGHSTLAAHTSEGHSTLAAHTSESHSTLAAHTSEGHSTLAAHTSEGHSILADTFTVHSTPANIFDGSSTPDVDIFAGHSTPAGILGYSTPADTSTDHSTPVDTSADHLTPADKSAGRSALARLSAGLFGGHSTPADVDSDVVIPYKTTKTISSATYLKEEESEGLTCLMTVDSKTVEQTYSWDAAGLRLYYPKGSLTDEDNGKEIKLEATISGNYHFPPNTKPVSAIYSITTDISAEVTLELEHCYRGNQQDLAFVYCLSRQPPFDFILATKESYQYSFTAKNGVIKTRHFSYWAIVRVAVNWFRRLLGYQLQNGIFLKIITFYQIVGKFHIKVDLVIMRGFSTDNAVSLTSFMYA